MKRFFLIWVIIQIFVLPSQIRAEKTWRSFTSSTRVYEIAVQGDYVWCATANGPVKFDIISKSFETLIDIPNNRLEFVEIDMNGDVWFGGTGGLYRYDGSKWKEYLSRNVKKIVTGNDGSIVVLTSYEKIYVPYDVDVYESIYLYDGSTFKNIYSAVAGYSSIRSIKVESSTSIYIQDDIGFFRYDGNSWYQEKMSKNVAKKSQSVWTGAPNGLMYFDGITTTTYSLCDPMPDNNIKHCSVDNNGALWMINDLGLTKYDGKTWTTFTEGDGIELKDATCVTTGPSGEVWIGTKMGAARYENTIWTAFTEDDGLPNNQVNAIATNSDGYVWFGTENGVCTYDGVTCTTYPTDGLESTSIGAIVIGQNDEIWVSTPNIETSVTIDKINVSKYDYSSWTTYTLDHNFNEQIEEISSGKETVYYKPYLLVGANGEIFVTFTVDFGSSGAYSLYYLTFLYEFKKPDWKKIYYYQFLSSCAVITSDNKIWYGTIPYRYSEVQNSGGLICCSRYAYGSYQMGVNNNGLISNHVSSVAISNDDVMWIGTPDGLTRYGEPKISTPTLIADESHTPSEINILGNYPNPFNQSTTIEFVLPNFSFTSLVIYNIMGQHVRELIAENMAKGNYSVMWDGRNNNGRPVSSGVYFSRLNAGTISTTGNMLLLK